MKILITGAHGFVGNRLMQDLDDTAATPSMRGMSEEQIRNMIEKSRAALSSIQQQSQMSGRVKKDPGASYEAKCASAVVSGKSSERTKN